MQEIAVVILCVGAGIYGISNVRRIWKGNSDCSCGQRGEGPLASSTCTERKHLEETAGKDELSLLVK